MLRRVKPAHTVEFSLFTQEILKLLSFLRCESNTDELCSVCHNNPIYGCARVKRSYHVRSQNRVI